MVIAPVFNVILGISERSLRNPYCRNRQVYGSLPCQSSSPLRIVVVSASLWGKVEVPGWNIYERIAIFPPFPPFYWFFLVLWWKVEKNGLIVSFVRNLYCSIGVWNMKRRADQFQSARLDYSTVALGAGVEVGWIASSVSTEGVEVAFQPFLFCSQSAMLFSM